MSQENLQNDDCPASEELKNKIAWAELPVDIGYKILNYLSSPDLLGYLKMMSKTGFLQPTESNYQTMCRYLYLDQSKRKALNVEKWGSWRLMVAIISYATKKNYMLYANN